MTKPSQLETIEIAGRRMTVARFGSEPVGIVLIHDGLGSIAQWRDVPIMIAAATGVGVLAYDRVGHGHSELITESGNTPKAQADWLHKEAAVLGELLVRYNLKDPLIVGHSDGGSIGLIHASNSQACRGLITLAAHSFVEQVCVTKILEMRSASGPIVFGLARYHKSPRQLFDSWSGVWTSAEFRDWDIRPILGAIGCPVLVVQGESDDYATDAQLSDTVAAIGENATAMPIAGAGHVLHHELPDEVVELVSEFFRSCS